MLIGIFSGHNNDIIIDLISDEAIPEPTIKTLLGALDYNIIRANKQSHAAIKLIRI
jgi:hypothetical protein